MPPMIELRPVDRFNVRVRDAATVLLAIGTAQGDAAFTLKPEQLNPLIEALIIASLNPKVRNARTPPPASRGVAEKVLTFPLERIAASHAPAKGTVSIVVTLPSGFHAAFEMSPQESLALSVELQSSAGQAQVPKSTSRH